MMGGPVSLLEAAVAVPFEGTVNKLASKRSACSIGKPFSRVSPPSPMNATILTREGTAMNCCSIGINWENRDQSAPLDAGLAPIPDPW
jgi:hypothetical protein